MEAVRDTTRAGGPGVNPVRVAFLGDGVLLQALSGTPERLIVSPVETNLEIAARVSRADVMVVDVTRNPQTTLKDIREVTYERPILALVENGQEGEAIAAGASGAVLKKSKPTTIATAIEALHEGLAVFAQSYAHNKLTTRTAPTSTHTGAHCTEAAQEILTPRENEVLALLADGLTNKDIASQLHISEHTAKFHVNSILQKMNAQKRVEAVVRAAKMGILTI